MANEIIRPSELPIRTNPVPSEVVPSDNNVNVAGVSWKDGVNSAVPPASQSESEAGVINSKRMTPLTTKQAIDAQVDPKISSAIGALNLGSASQSNVEDFATAAQGAKADSAVQPGNPALLPAGGSTSQVLIKSTNADYDTEWATSAAATAVSYAPQVLTDEQRLQAQSNLSLVNFKTVPLLLADTSMSYTADPGKIHVGPGDIITAQGFRYEVAAVSAADHHVDTEGGVKLYALPGERGIWLEQLGVVFDGVTDNTSTLQRISTALTNYRGVLSAGFGVCKLSGTFEVPRHASFICNGAVFDAAGSTGVFDTAVILKRGATPERIADLTVDANEFGVTLTFATPHNRAVGDTILLFNPIDGSFFAGRPVYREGQFAKVGEVVSSTELRVDRELYATHDHNVTEMYSCDDLATGIMEGFTAVAPGAGTGNGEINGWRVEYAEGVELKNTASRGSDNVSAVLRLGFRCKGSGQNEHQIGANPGLGTQYGFSISNCQESTFVGGTYEGNRHGVALGGFNEFSIPNREVHVLKFAARTHNGDLAAADWHGNVEYCSYEDGTCYGGGVNIAGDRNKIRNITVHGDDKCFGIFGREIVGMSHEVSNVTLYLGRQDTNRGVGIDIGGDSIAFASNCRRGGMLDVSNLTVHARNQNRRVIRVTNRGYVGDPWSVRVRGLTVHMPNAEATFALVQVTAQSGYDQPQSMEVTSVEALGMPVARKLVALCDASVPLRLDSQSGVVSLTTGTDKATILSDLQEFLRFTYPRAPHPVVSMIGTNTDGTNRIGAYASLVDTDRIRVGISRTDGVGNFSGAVTRQVSWKVGIKDF